MHPCKSCNSRIGEGVYCITCERQLGICQQPATELRAVYERAYFAALGGLAGLDGLADVETVYHAQQCALETVRQWPAMMAELEREIAK